MNQKCGVVEKRNRKRKEKGNTGCEGAPQGDSELPHGEGVGSITETV